jgi:hypothetical protein
MKQKFKTTHPDIKLSFNDWARYIKAEIMKTKYNTHEGKHIKN